MATKLHHLLHHLESWARPEMAADWDAIGVSVGGGNPLVDRIMLALTPTLAVVEHAVKTQCQVLIAHHPFLFKPIKRIDPSTPQGKAIQLALQHSLIIYGIHTNLDTTTPGVSDVLATKLGLQKLKVLAPTYRDHLVKLATFVPSAHIPALIEAMGEAGAGQIGEYSRCSFRTPGIGTYIPSERANPYAGTKGELAQEPEERLEMILPERLLSAVVAALKTSHPYEEVAYDLYPLKNDAGSLGIGRIGTLETPTTLGAFSQTVKAALSADGLRVLGDPQQKIKKVAVAGGSCGDMWYKAFKAGADAFVTSDVKYHDALEAHEAGLAILDAGHWATEAPVLDLLQQRLLAVDPTLTLERLDERVPF